MVITVIEIIIIIITMTILLISIRILIIMYILAIVNDSLVSHNTQHFSIIGQKVTVWDFPQLR